MNDKYAKKIAEELKLIRRELEKQNKNTVTILSEQEQDAVKQHFEGV